MSTTSSSGRLTDQITSYQTVLDSMRTKLATFDEEQRNEVEQAAAVLRKVRAGAGRIQSAHHRRRTTASPMTTAEPDAVRASTPDAKRAQALRESRPAGTAARNAIR